MSFENATTISGLSPSDPQGDDPTNEGDDHIKMLKTVLQNMFPSGSGGGGFTQPVLSTEDELNVLVGITTTTSLQAQLDVIRVAIGSGEGVLYAPAGTRMLFHQSSSPAGWVADDTVGNRMVVTGPQSEGRTSGGGSDARNFTHAHSTQDMTLNTSQIPLHTHNMRSNDAGAGGFLTWDSSQSVQMQFTSGTGAYNTGDTQGTGGSAAHGHGNTGTYNWQPFYTQIIICVKS